MEQLRQLFGCQQLQQKIYEIPVGQIVEQLLEADRLRPTRRQHASQAVEQSSLLSVIQQTTTPRMALVVDIISSICM